MYVEESEGVDAGAQKHEAARRRGFKRPSNSLGAAIIETRWLDVNRIGGAIEQVRRQARMLEAKFERHRRGGVLIDGARRSWHRLSRRKRDGGLRSRHSLSGREFDRSQLGGRCRGRHWLSGCRRVGCGRGRQGLRVDAERGGAEKHGARAENHGEAACEEFRGESNARNTRTPLRMACQTHWHWTDFLEGDDSETIFVSRV